MRVPARRPAPAAALAGVMAGATVLAAVLPAALAPGEAPQVHAVEAFADQAHAPQGHAAQRTSASPQPPSATDQDGPTPQILDSARRLAARQGPAHAGSYWDAGSAQMVVRVAAGSPRDAHAAATPVAQGAQAAGEAGRADVRLEPAPYPLAELQTLADRLAAAHPADLAESYVDERAGQVVLVARPGTSRTLAAAASDARVLVREGAGEPVAVAAGSPLVGGGAACTLGFTGTRRGVPVFLTAGHCGREGTAFTSDGRSAGSVTDVVFPESDYAIGVFEGTGRRGVVATGPGSTVPVRGSLQAPVGARICSMGSASGWACGTIVATGVTVRYGDGQTTRYVRGLTKVALCRSGGDSGGPWLWGTQAQGLTSGGAGSHGPGCTGTTGEQAAYLQPINPVLEATGVVLDIADS